MSLDIRAVTVEDVDACGRVAFDAHQHVAALLHVPPEHPTLAFSTGLIAAKLKDPRATGWLAERDGEIVGSVFLNDFSPTPVAAIGPLTVHPTREGGVGRALMEVALAQAAASVIPSVRLVQSPSHLRSFVLYAKLGFVAREPLMLMQGTPPRHDLNGANVRAATETDIEACRRLAQQVMGLSRDAEVDEAIAHRTAAVLDRGGVIRAYATGLGLRGHAVGETADDVIALLPHTPKLPGPGFLLPIRNSVLVQWALRSGLTAAWPALLMTKGPYVAPTGAVVPSIAF